MDVLETIKSWLGSAAESDVRAALAADHERLKTLASAMAEADGARKRMSVFAELKPFLTAHARAEEAVVYDAMIRAGGGREGKDLGNEGFVEHSLVDVLLQRLAKTELAGTDAWKAHATVLKELLEHHIDEEEREFFDVLGERFDAGRREAMAHDFLALRDELLAEAGDEAPDQRHE